MKSITIPISNTQQKIILGTILGDGCLEFNGCVGSRLQIKQASKSKEYVFWLYAKLQNLCNSQPKMKKDTGQWYFSTRSLKNLTDVRDKFYRNGDKIIPNNILQLLVSPLSLAVWYMDDGTLDYRPNSHCSFSIATHSFSLCDVRMLVSALKYNFGVEASIHNNLMRGVRYPRIYIGAKGRDKFIKIISPFILDCFKYKLPQYRQPLRDFSRIRFAVK